MFTPGWKSLVRDGSYKLDNEQMDNLRRYIQDHYLQKALQSQVIDLTSTDPEDDQSNLHGQSALSVINGQRPNGVHPTSSQQSLNSVLDDISFLGPGQMSQPPNSSPSNIDLSMLGPGEVHTTSARLPDLRGGRASLTEKLREQANSSMLNGRSQAPEKPSDKNYQQTQEESEDEASPDSTARKKLLSTWLHPSDSFCSVATPARKFSSSYAENIQRTSGSSPAISKPPPNTSRKPESELSTPLTKVETENGVDSGSAQQWVSSLFTKSDLKPPSKVRLSAKKMSSKASTPIRRGPYRRKLGRSVRQGKQLP